MVDLSSQILLPELLTRAAFSAYGDVIELSATDPISINNGNCLRYSNLASPEICSSGTVGISLFDAKAYANPLTLSYVERHPLGSQAFLPTSDDPYLIIVADDEEDAAQRPRVFFSDGYQGVNYHRNIWHGVLTPIVKQSLFIVVDYIGTENNLQEFYFEAPYLIDFGSFLKNPSPDNNTFQGS